MSPTNSDQHLIMNPVFTGTLNLNAVNEVKLCNLNSYHNDAKFSDKQVCVKCADPDQRISLIRVYTVCLSDCIFWTHYSIVEPHCSNFRLITAIFRVSEYLEILQYMLEMRILAGERSVHR